MENKNPFGLIIWIAMSFIVGIIVEFLLFNSSNPLVLIAVIIASIAYSILSIATWFFTDFSIFKK